MDIAVGFYDRDSKKIFCLAATVDNSQRIFYAPASELGASKIAWKPLTEREDEIYNLSNDETHMFLYTPKNAPNFKLLRMPVDDPDISRAEIFIPERNNFV